MNTVTISRFDSNINSNYTIIICRSNSSNIISIFSILVLVLLVMDHVTIIVYFVLFFKHSSSKTMVLV